MADVVEMIAELAATFRGKLNSNFTALQDRIASLEQGGGGQTVELDELDAATDADGAELVPILQGGVAKSMTPEVMRGNACGLRWGLGRDKREFFTDFDGVWEGYSMGAPTVSGDPQHVATERCIVGYVDDVGASIQGLTDIDGSANSAALFNGVEIHTGANVGGWGAVVTSHRLFYGLRDTDIRFTVGLRQALPDGAKGNYSVYLGLINEPDGNEPTSGVYFRADSSSPYWHCVIDNGVVAPYVFNTNVTIVLQHVFAGATPLRIEVVESTASVKFSIDGVVIHEKLISEAPWPAQAIHPSRMGALLKKDSVTESVRLSLWSFNLDEVITRTVINGAEHA